MKFNYNRIVELRNNHFSFEQITIEGNEEWIYKYEYVPYSTIKGCKVDVELNQLLNQLADNDNKKKEVLKNPTYEQAAELRDKEYLLVSLINKYLVENDETLITNLKSIQYLINPELEFQGIQETKRRSFIERLFNK